MKLIRLAFAFAVLLTLPGAASAGGRPPSGSGPAVEWMLRLPVAIRRHEVTDRPLLVWFTGDHCIHCRRMERDTWSHPEVARRVQQQFVPVKLRAGEHRDMLKRLGIRGVPTTMIFDRSGRHVRTLAGYAGPEELQAALAAVSVPRQTHGTVLRPGAGTASDDVSGRVSLSEIPQ